MPGKRLLRRIAGVYGFAALFLLIAWSALIRQLPFAEPHQYQLLWLAGAVLVLLISLVSALLWISIARRIQNIRNTVHEYGRGRFDKRLATDADDELGALARDLNWLARQYEEHFAAESRRHQENDLVLSSMTEGVFAVDADRHLLSINRAARSMLGLQPMELTGRPISDYVRNLTLLEFIDSALKAKDPVEMDLLLAGPVARHVHASSAVLADAGGQRLGALIMLDDITQVKQLENVRREFVANVSHELKTPITSIKGFMETLMDGTKHSPEDTQRFLEIIARQADRLDAIIEDLLSLSRIEQESERGEIHARQERLIDIVNAAVLATRTLAENRNATIALEIPENLVLHINAALIEQALINLVDNAIKYSEPGKTVRISAHQAGREAHINVRDEGPGIEAIHQDRIFERFYRIDKSRSRKLGGTGLGLSIVKHIAHIHGGRVAVKSSPGKGSTFTISLPM